MKVLLVLRKRWTMLFPDEKERGRSEMVKHIPGLLKHLRKLTMTVISLDLPFLIVLSCFMPLINTRWAWSLAARVGQPLCSVSLQLAWPGSQARRRPPTRRGWRWSHARISGEKSFKDREKGRPLFYLQCNPHIGVEERPRTSIPVRQLASLRPLGPWEMCLPHIERARIQ